MGFAIDFGQVSFLCPSQIVPSRRLTTLDVSSVSFPPLHHSVTLDHDYCEIVFHSSLLILQPVCEIRISDLLQVADKNTRVLPNLYNLPQMGTYFPVDPKTRLKEETFNLKTSVLTTGPNMHAEETV